MDRQFHDKSPVVNQSLFNPDWIYGMMNPKAPYVNRQLIWHMYSGQAYGEYSFDGRGSWTAAQVREEEDQKS